MRPTIVRSPDAWNQYFAVARDEHRAERRRLHAAAIAALLLHCVFFALRLPETARPEAQISPPIRFPLEDFRPRRPVEPPPPKTESPAATTQPTIIVPGPPEVNIVPAVEFTPIAVDVAVPQIEPLAVLPPPPPAPPANQPVRYDASIEKPVKIYAPLPHYTSPARRLRREGRVILEAIINEQGLVTDVALLKGLGWGLDEAALETVATWRFEPARRNGRAIAVIYNLVINFQLD